MSGNPHSVTGQISNTAQTIGGQIHHFIEDPFNMVPNPGQPGAPPPPPDPGAATQTALQNQLNQEVQMRGMAANVTGGEGIAETPMTAGQSLLGY